GWNQVSIAQLATTLDYPVPIAFEHSHNVLIDLIIWNGPLLGILIIMLAAFWLIQLARNTCSIHSAFGLLLIGIVLIHSMFEFPLEYAFFLIPVCLALGMVECHQQAPATFKMPRSIFAALIIASITITGCIWHEYR